MMGSGADQKVIIADNLTLDFSKLFGQEKQAPKIASDRFETGNEYKVSSQETKHNTDDFGSLQGQVASKLVKKATEERDQRAEAQRICREHQANTAKSQILQSEILKGLQLGEDIYSLFLKAAKAISLMTANSLFYSQAEKDLISIYGIGLKEKPALWIELESVEDRLGRLEEAIGREADPDNQDRIKRAITAHRSRAEDLRRMIGDPQ